MRQTGSPRQEWARQYPDRVPAILVSPLAVLHLQVLATAKGYERTEVCAHVHRNWNYKFPSNVTQIVLKLHGSSQLNSTQALNSTATCEKLPVRIWPPTASCI